jgi:hypothetical protein
MGEEPIQIAAEMVSECETSWTIAAAMLLIVSFTEDPTCRRSNSLTMPLEVEIILGFVSGL